jgi:hypothetical protein
MASNFRPRTDPQQMNPGGEPGVLARRRRKRGGRHSEPLLGGELLTVREAAAHLGISWHTLHYWRFRRPQSGPPYIKVHTHAIRYRLCDLEAFLESRLVEPGREAQRKK